MMQAYRIVKQSEMLQIPQFSEEWQKLVIFHRVCDAETERSDVHYGGQERREDARCHRAAVFLYELALRIKLCNAERIGSYLKLQRTERISQILQRCRQLLQRVCARADKCEMLQCSHFRWQDGATLHRCVIFFVILPESFHCFGLERRHIAPSVHKFYGCDTLHWAHEHYLQMSQLKTWIQQLDF